MLPVTSVDPAAAAQSTTIDFKASRCPDGETIDSENSTSTMHFRPDRWNDWGTPAYDLVWFPARVVSLSCSTTWNARTASCAKSSISLTANPSRQASLSGGGVKSTLAILAPT